MKKKILTFLLSFCVLLSMLPMTTFAKEEPVSAIYGGGPFYQGGQSVMNTLRASGFNTVMLWSIHVQENGDLYLNDIKICSNGSYIGNPAWVNQLTSLKTAPTSVKRIEVSVGAWGCKDFENIRTLINAQGTGTNSILYKNFLALKEATGADAVNYDDESCYDVTSAVTFGKMCAQMGYKITLAPYTRSSFWSSVKQQLGATVDRVYLQCYAGGSGNTPSAWNSSMGTKVIPGLWCLNSSSGGDSATQVNAQLREWKDSISGGFMWLYDDMQNLASPNATADYANAINSAFNTITPPSTDGNIALNKAATANQYVSNETPSKAVDGFTSNNSKWCSTTSGDKWLKLDLGQSYTINRWVVKHAGAGGESSLYNTKSFKLQKSVNGTTWTDVDAISNNTSNITDRTISNFSARYVRLYITKPSQTSDSAARIYEFELYSPQ